VFHPSKFYSRLSTIPIAPNFPTLFHPAHHPTLTSFLSLLPSHSHPVQKYFTIHVSQQPKFPYSATSQNLFSTQPYKDILSGWRCLMWFDCLPNQRRVLLVGKNKTRRSCCCREPPRDAGYLYTVSQKKQSTIILSITSPNVDWFSKFFIDRFASKYATKSSLTILPHLTCVAELPCETSVSEIAKIWWMHRYQQQITR